MTRFPISRSALRLPRPLRHALPTALALALVLPAAAFASADDDDHTFIRFGGQRAVFHDKNAGFQGPGIPAGAQLQTDTEDLSAVYLSIGHNITPHVEVEAIMGIPPDFHVHARGPASVGAVPYNGQPVLSGKQAAPAFAVNYKFNEPGDFYRPYFGAGLVYSHFYDITGTAQNNAINGGPTSITFTDSLGLLLVAGVSFHVADHWRANFSVTHADVRPQVTTHTLGADRVNNYDLQPVVFTAALSYGF